MIELIKSHIFNSFSLECEISDDNLIKVNRIDKHSLAQWISEEFNNVKVTVGKSEWLKIETNIDNKHTMTE